MKFLLVGIYDYNVIPASLSGYHVELAEKVFYGAARPYSSTSSAAAAATLT